MNKFYAAFIVLVLAIAGFNYGLKTEAQENQQKTNDNDNLTSPNVVIGQFFGGGGNSATAPYANDYVVLFNRGSAPVNLNGWSTQYASATGTNWLVTPLSNITLQPGQYYLIQYAGGGSGGANLPTPDLIAPAVTSPSGTFIPNLSATTGKLALVNSMTQLPASVCPSDPGIVDLVGYGDTASCFEGAKTANLSATTAGIRNGGGCADTDNNANDFTIGTPAPKNTASPTVGCNIGSTLQATGGASPSTVSPAGTTLLTVAVTPATTPPSTGITVTGNLVNIGGSGSQQFFDNGTNGDVTPNDNIFSYLATIPGDLGGGQITVTATAADVQARTATVTINLTINAQPTGENPLLLGNPTNATDDVANENNYLMIKPQYSLSYNRSRGEANWVAWRLDSTWLGTAPRQDDYRPDPSLPAGWYQVTTSDYSGSGYDRGHMCPSGDRTRSVPDNSATFLMTNFVPQLAANNQGPWEDFESYCRTLANAGNELYIFSGGAGNAGTIAQGRVVVPTYTWKVVVVMPNGNNDLQRVGKTTRTIAIVVPNQPPVNINAPWRDFRKTVDQVEALTGFDFFSLVPKNTQELIERKRDTQ